MTGLQKSGLRGCLPLKKLRQFAGLSGREKRLFLEAVLLHLWAGLVLKLIPFRLVPRWFGTPEYSQQPAAGSRQSGTIRPEEVHCRATLPVPREAETDAIRRAVSRAGRVSPWRNRCLVSSLAGRLMLRRRKIPSVLSLGVIRRPDGRLDAHAWLTSGETEIVARGGDITEMYIL